MRAKAVLAGAIAAVVVAGLGIAAALGAFSSSGTPAAAAGVRVEANATIAVLGANGKAVGSRRVAVDLLTVGVGHADRVVWGILSGHDTAGSWDVSVGGTACPTSNRGFCQLFETGAEPKSFTATADAKTLEVALATAKTGTSRVVLAGTLPATRKGTIVRVSTGLQLCPRTATAGRDCGAAYNPVSDTYLATPLHVTAGQRLSIRVVIGFGT